MDEHKIIPFVEPIFRFCYQRLNDRYDAEDLAGEIFCHVLEGMGKYKIESFEAWVWRIAHNRYAHFLKERNRNQEYASGEVLYEMEEDYSRADEESQEEYEKIFRCLHTLSSAYRDLFVDYYIGEMSIRQLAHKYSLPETTVKWRLNVGRSKIRERIGEESMDKVYQRINWNSKSCNGNLDSERYLHTQIARAVCRAAYEKPLTVEEISLNTGIPTMYLEDELPRLEYGDAVKKIGNKYGTDFIIFRLKDREQTEAVLNPLANKIADYYGELFGKHGDAVRELGFYGCRFGMERLGYILIPYFLRKKIREIKENRLNMPNGNYPPRKDGGYGWFIVEETADGEEKVSGYSTGCNRVGNAGGNLYYYWMGRYFDDDLYGRGGMRFLRDRNIPGNCPNGAVPEELLGEEDRLRLLRVNLLVKDGGGYRLNFPCFTGRQFDDFVKLFDGDEDWLEEELADWLRAVRRNFEGFVPKRLHDQINQWVSYYAGEIAGHVLEEMIRRGVLEQPVTEISDRAEQAVSKPLADGVFYLAEERAEAL